MPPPGFLKSNNNTEEWASWWTEGRRGREGGREHLEEAAGEDQTGGSSETRSLMQLSFIYVNTDNMLIAQ